jgi:hypothetical protein
LETIEPPKIRGYWLLLLSEAYHDESDVERGLRYRQHPAAFGAQLGFNHPLSFSPIPLKFLDTESIACYIAVSFAWKQKRLYSPFVEREH